MPFFPSFAGDRPGGRRPARSLPDDGLAVAVVALLPIGLSGEVCGALAALMTEVEGARNILPMH